MPNYYIGINHGSFNLVGLIVPEENLLDAVKKAIRHYMSDPESVLPIIQVKAIVTRTEWGTIEPFDFNLEDLDNINSQTGVSKFTREYTYEEFFDKTQGLILSKMAVWYDEDKEDACQDLDSLDPNYILDLLVETNGHPKFVATDVWVNREYEDFFY